MLPTKVRFMLAKRFQRRRLKSERLTDDVYSVMAKAHIAFGKVNLKEQLSTKHFTENVMAILLALSVVDRGFGNQSGQRL